MELELGGRTALVIGGSRGIGKAIATELAAEGARVAISGRTRSDLETAASQITATGTHPVVSFECDTRDAHSVDRMVSSVLEQFGHIDILVNCAAQPGGLLHQLQPGGHRALADDLDTKVIGYLRCIEAVVPSMQERGWGRIVNLGGLAARGSSSVSGMRNLALVHLGKTLSDQLGAYGITVNTVHPGATRTEQTETQDTERIRNGEITREEIDRRRRDSNAIGRMVDAREIGWLVAFLCSPKAAAITGESIAAGGGVGHAVFP